MMLREPVVPSCRPSGRGATPPICTMWGKVPTERIWPRQLRVNLRAPAVILHLILKRFDVDIPPLKAAPTAPPQRSLGRVSPQTLLLPQSDASPTPPGSVMLSVHG